MKKKKIAKKLILPLQEEEVIKEEKIEKDTLILPTNKNAVSVIIPAKDRAESTKKLVEELLFQKTHYYPETEIIVVENGSSEDMSFLDAYENIVVRHEEEDGVSHARNVGMSLAHGKFIAFIDNDDFISRDYLHHLYQTMRNTDCDWARILCQVDNTPYYDNETFDINNPVKTCVSTMCYCYNARILQNKKFNEHLNIGEDKEWLEKVIQPGMKGAKCPKITLFVKWEDNEDSLCHRFNRGEITRER